MHYLGPCVCRTPGRDGSPLQGLLGVSCSAQAKGLQCQDDVGSCRVGAALSPSDLSPRDLRTSCFTIAVLATHGSSGHMLPWLLLQMCSLWSEQAVPAPAPATCSGVQHARSAACRASWLAAAPVHGPALVTYSRLRMCPWMAPTLRFSASFTLPLFWAWVRGLLPQVAHGLARGGHAHISRLPTTYRYGACCRPKGPDRTRAGTEVCVLHCVAGPICWRGSSAWCCCTWTCRVRWLYLPAAAESSQMDFVKHRQLAHAS